MEPLVQASELAGFPGAPFLPAVVDAAAAAIRAEAGWHIAPVIFETIEEETDGGTLVLLPSLQIEEIVEVRNADTGAVIPNWRVNKARGVLHSRGGPWPEVIEVDWSHGYAQCPPELIPVIVERSQRGQLGIIRKESIGSRSVDYWQEYNPSSVNAVTKHTLSSVSG